MPRYTWLFVLMLAGITVVYYVTYMSSQDTGLPSLPKINWKSLVFYGESSQPEGWYTFHTSDVSNLTDLHIEGLSYGEIIDKYPFLVPNISNTARKRRYPSTIIIGVRKGGTSGLTYCIY